MTRLLRSAGFPACGNTGLSSPVFPHCFFAIDLGGAAAIFIRNTGKQAFTYSPLDTPATVSGGVILF
jgi:hypothetical protein